MKRHEENKSEMMNEELQQFEDQLRALKPQRASHQLPQAATFAQVDSLAPASVVARQRLNVWVLAASLLLMWSLGAGMGAVAAVAWLGDLKDDPADSAIPVATKDDPRSHEGAHGQFVVPSMAKSQLTERSQQPAVSQELPQVTTESAGMVTSVFAMPFQSIFELWNAPMPEMSGDVGPWTPKTAYFISRQSVSAVLGTDSVQPFAANRKEQRYAPLQLPFIPTPSINQRDLLRGMLNGESSRIY